MNAPVVGLALGTDVRGGVLHPEAWP